MVEKHIEDYVKENLARGYDPESIREMLRVSGYDPRIVDSFVSPGQGGQSLSDVPVKQAAGTTNPVVPLGGQAVPGGVGGGVAKERPLWLTIYAVASIIQGLIFILLGLGATVLASVFSGMIGGFVGFVVLGIIFGVLFIVTGILNIVGGIGLFKLKGWGYTVTVVSLILGIISYLGSSNYIMAVVDGCVVYYFYKNRALFAK